MESWNIESMLVTIVESMLPQFHDKKIGLIMALSFDWNSMKSNGEPVGRFTRKHMLLFHRPTNYTKVLYRDITDVDTPLFLFIRDLKPNPLRMKLLSDHDTCWRSDGLRWIFQTFCDAWEYFDDIKVDGRKEDPNIRFMPHAGEPHYRYVDLRPDYNCKDHVRDVYVNVQGAVPLRDISQYMPKQRR